MHFTTRVGPFRFVDDVEIALRRGEGAARFRSSSRTGCARARRRCARDRRHRPSKCPSTDSPVGRACVAIVPLASCPLAKGRWVIWW
jgi:hypothetical protein